MSVTRIYDNSTSATTDLSLDGNGREVSRRVYYFRLAAQLANNALLNIVIKPDIYCVIAARSISLDGAAAYGITCVKTDTKTVTIKNVSGGNMPVGTIVVLDIGHTST